MMKFIIFAGGAGTRLWPLSRKKSPKQFEKIVGDQSTLQLAAHRLLPDFSWKDMYVSTGARYTSLIHDQLPEIPKHQVIGEPMMRDVGPAVGLLTSILVRECPKEPMVILWSDHLVKKDELFRKLITVAGHVVEKDPNRIVFISQKPRFASENLGWIEYGKSVKTVDGIKLHEFKNFQYRPDKNTAKKYFESGHHAWNLGYFVTTPGFLWNQYKQFAPNLYADLNKIADTWETPKFEKTIEEIYPKVEKISFDNAILEKLDTSVPLVISENIEWSDIGAWEALKEALQESEEQNVIQGKVLTTDTVDSLVYNYTDQLLVTIDLEDALVVNTGDVLLVCKKTSVPKIKKMVESLSGTEHDHLT
jgi:mannose-1-phosphate guanylyltransferase